MEQEFSASPPVAAIAPNVNPPQAGAAAQVIPAPENIPPDQDTPIDEPHP